MAGHGFNSEIAQNKSMAASFDNNSSNDSPKSQRSQQISSSLTNQSNSTEPSLGKKVKFFLKIYFDFFLLLKIYLVDINIGRKRTYDACR